MIDTTKVANRRAVHYDTLDDLLADAERLAAAPTLRSVGNWSPGQIFKHVALIMHGCIDGFDAKAPWYIRLIMRPMRGWVLNRPMSPGYKLPPDAAAVLIPGATTLEEGLDLFRKGIQRLKTETTRHPSPFLGTLTVDEWNKLHLRHAELHLSFLVVD